MKRRCVLGVFPALPAFQVLALWNLTPLRSRAEVLGPTYPIQEPDMLLEIERHLREKEGTRELARLQEEALRRSQRTMTEPAPVEGLRRTGEPRSFYFDPSIVANRRITTPDGKVLVEAGQRLNPLDQVSMTQWLVFFDARDGEQVRRAEILIQQARGRAKAILTGGSYIDLQKRWKHPVFFDQAGVLVRKLGIRQVPARVMQEGKRLRIDEVRV